MRRNSLLASQPLSAPQAMLPRSSVLMRLMTRRQAGSAAWVEVTAAGDYDTAPAVSSAVGAGCTFTALMRGRAVVAVRVDGLGISYPASFPLTFTGGGGAGGAAATGFAFDGQQELAASAATDLVWVYLDVGMASWISAIKAQGVRVQGTISGLPSSTELSACSLSMDQQPVRVPWLAGSGRAFGASWRQAYRTRQLAGAGTQRAAGADWIQFDDYSPDTASVTATPTEPTGGGFDPETLAAFGRPGYVSELTAAGVVQRRFDWVSQTYLADIPPNNWYARAATGNEAQFPARAAWMGVHRQGVLQVLDQIKAANPGTMLSVNAFDLALRPDSLFFGASRANVVIFETDPRAFSRRVSDNGYADRRERFTALWHNARTCEALGPQFAPQLQPLYNGTVDGIDYVSTRAECVAELLSQFALTYALGGLPCVPADTFRVPFAPGVANDRWFAKRTDGFNAMTAMVRANPQLFDAPAHRGALLLAVDPDTLENRARATTMDWAETCCRQGIPAAMYPVGPACPRRSDLEDAALAIVNLSPTTSVVTGPKVRSLASYPVARWSEFSAARLAGTATDVLLLPRVSSDRTVVHVVSFDGVARPGLLLTIPWWALPRLARRDVLWYEPGQPAQRPVVYGSDAGLVVRLPPLAVWGVVSVEV